MNTDAIGILAVSAIILGTSALAVFHDLSSAKAEPVAITCSQKQYPAKVVRVVDGDTVVVQVDLGFDLTYKVKVRLSGIDTPEVFGKDRDPVRGPAATKATKAWVSYQPGAQVLYVDEGTDKYGGRRNGTLLPLDGGPSLSEALIQGGHEK